MLKIYGSMLCKDCVQCRAALDEAHVSYQYLDFADDLQNMKDFLAIRDSNAVFDLVRQKGGIGIPCIVKEDGTVVLDWSEFM